MNSSVAQTVADKLGEKDSVQKWGMGKSWEAEIGITDEEETCPLYPQDGER